MQLNHGLHLAYCTNVHRGETWAETFDSLKNYTIAVRDRVCPAGRYGIGLRLSHRAATELIHPATLLEFQRWLDLHRCYVFTLNGFPYGQFHGKPVKDQVYAPDWASPDRCAYTHLLFDILAELVPVGIEGSVSTLPGSFKGFHPDASKIKAMRENIWHCVEHIARISEQAGRKLHLGLEPEPLCLLESSAETIQFFERLRAEHPHDPRLAEHLGVNYDTCHFAVEFEEPQNAIACLVQHGIKISKIHISSALRMIPTTRAREAVAMFADDVYLHQVVIRNADGSRVIYPDLRDALMAEPEEKNPAAPSQSEWRIHFHIPLHHPPADFFQNTNAHILGILDILAVNPRLCSHLEMETYTWEILPAELKSRNVVDQIAGEYEWTLARLLERGLASR